MNAQSKLTPAMGWAEKADARLGRTDWVWADYVAEGGRQFDAMLAAAGKTLTPAWAIERRRNARAFAEINCPASKRGLSSIPSDLVRAA